MFRYLIFIIGLVVVNPPGFASQVLSTGACTYQLSVTTSASRETIWQLWEDVENWKSYDTILEYSYLIDNAPFTAGAFGYVKARGAPKTKFELLEVKSGVSFVESLKLPLFSSLLLKRRFEFSEDGNTIFTHEVEFKGAAKYPMCLFMAGTFKKELPRVMHNLRDLAEKREAEDDGAETPGPEELPDKPESANQETAKKEPESNN